MINNPYSWSRSRVSGDRGSGGERDGMPARATEAVRTDRHRVEDNRAGTEDNDRYYQRIRVGRCPFPQIIHTLKGKIALWGCPVHGVTCRRSGVVMWRHGTGWVSLKPFSEDQALLKTKGGRYWASSMSVSGIPAAAIKQLNVSRSQLTKTENKLKIFVTSISVYFVNLQSLLKCYKGTNGPGQKILI